MKNISDNTASRIPTSVAITPRENDGAMAGIDAQYSTFVNLLKSNVASENGIIVERLSICGAVLGWHYKNDGEPVPGTNRRKLGVSAKEMANKLAKETGLSASSFQTYISTMNLGLKVTGRGKAMEPKHKGLHDAILNMDLMAIARELSKMGRSFADIREVLTRTEARDTNSPEAQERKKERDRERGFKRMGDAIQDISAEKDAVKQIVQVLKDLELLEAVVAMATSVRKGKKAA